MCGQWQDVPFQADEAELLASAELEFTTVQDLEPVCAPVPVRVPVLVAAPRALSVLPALRERRVVGRRSTSTSRRVADVLPLDRAVDGAGFLLQLPESADGAVAAPVVSSSHAGAVRFDPTPLDTSLVPSMGVPSFCPAAVPVDDVGRPVSSHAASSSDASVVGVVSHGGVVSGVSVDELLLASPQSSAPCGASSDDGWVLDVMLALSVEVLPHAATSGVGLPASPTVAPVLDAEIALDPVLDGMRALCDDRRHGRALDRDRLQAPVLASAASPDDSVADGVSVHHVAAYAVSASSGKDEPWSALRITAVDIAAHSLATLDPSLEARDALLSTSVAAAPSPEGPRAAHRCSFTSVPASTSGTPGEDVSRVLNELQVQPLDLGGTEGLLDDLADVGAQQVLTASVVPVSRTGGWGAGVDASYCRWPTADRPSRGGRAHGSAGHRVPQVAQADRRVVARRCGVRDGQARGVGTSRTATSGCAPSWLRT